MHVQWTMCMTGKCPWSFSTLWYFVHNTVSGMTVLSLLTKTVVVFVIAFKGGSKISSLQIFAGPLRPKSVGHLKLKSTDPLDPPVIQPNYLSTEQDRQEMRDSIRLARKIISQKAFDAFRGKELLPGRAGFSQQKLPFEAHEHFPTIYVELLKSTAQQHSFSLEEQQTKMIVLTV